MGNLTDWQAMRCGHNYEPDACRADYCGFRDAVNELKRLRAENGRLRSALKPIMGRDTCTCGTSICNWCRGAGWISISPDELTAIRHAMEDEYDNG